MGTRSTIAILKKDGTVISAYCHSDGYLSHNGAMLYLHYSNVEKVNELLSLNSIAFIQENIHPPLGVQHDGKKRFPNVTIFHERDYKTEVKKNEEHNSLENYLKEKVFEEYNYVFYEKKNAWYLVDPKLNKLKKLITYLEKDSDTQEELGEEIKRRKEMSYLNKKLNKELPQENIKKSIKKIKL